MKLKSIFNQIVDYITYITDPEEIILFGSMAVATNDVSSDIDLLIVSQIKFQRSKIALDIKTYIAQMGYRSDIIILTIDELNVALNAPESLLHNALKKSKNIFKKNEKKLVI